MYRLLVLPLTVVLFGCSGEPQSIGELRSVAVNAREEAVAARDAKDPKQADRAATRAEEAATAAAAMVEAAAQPTEADKQAVKEAAAAAREARSAAGWAREEKELADIVSGWKAKAYRGSRKVALAAVFTGMALAAEQAGKSDLDSLPQPVRENAELAAELAAEYAGREPLPNGQPDWEGIALDLQAFRSQEPEDLGQCLALAFILSAQPRLALYEIELVDPRSLKTPDRIVTYHILRGVILSENDLRRFAVREFETLDTLTGENEQQYSGPELLAAIHLLAAYVHLRDRQYRRADLELVRAMRVWPNNSVSVFLTGERLAAEGQYEKAADSLEQAARGTQHQWLAERITQRARQLRDDEGEAEPLLTDKRFMCEVALHYIGEAAKQSEAAESLQQSVAAAKQFGNNMLEHLPGVGTGKSQ